MVRRMNLLAIDTALDRCSVGVAASGRPPVLVSETIGRGHAERLFGMISAAISEAEQELKDLDRIAVTIGPGSFTGLRVGIAAARGLALVIGCPVVGIGTLDAIAEKARILAGNVPVLAALDAKRGEIYAQAFDGDGRALSEPEVGPAARFGSLLGDGMAIAGSGARLVRREVNSAGAIIHEESAPDIAAVVRLGLAAATEPTGSPRPLYLRPPDAKPQTAAAIARQ
jgi:tRNA threonylcarbamoyladenosine biosynthesis protein TsaB